MMPQSERLRLSKLVIGIVYVELLERNFIIEYFDLNVYLRSMCTFSAQALQAYIN